MPLDVEGTTYYSATEIIGELGISRQTLWRWRQDGKVPIGRRYRGREVLFTKAELATIRGYAHRMEPAETAPAANQLSLFGTDDGRTRR